MSTGSLKLGMHKSLSASVAVLKKLQRRACKLILLNEYVSLNESLEQLHELGILSFDHSVFLTKAKVMYKIYNNLAPSYLHECNLFKGSLSFSGVLIRLKKLIFPKSIQQKVF